MSDELHTVHNRKGEPNERWEVRFRDPDEDREVGVVAAYRTQNECFAFVHGWSAGQDRLT